MKMKRLTTGFFHSVILTRKMFSRTSLIK
jgi:hypothetical protein